MQKRPLLIAIFLIASIIFVLPACTSVTEFESVTPTTVTTETAIAPTAEPTGILNYALKWNTEGITHLSDGGWQVTTNLGYEIRVTSGYVTTFRMELVECETTEAAAFSFLFPSPVQAGHPSDGPSETRTSQDTVENLITLPTQSMASLPVSRADWCTLHYLAGPTTDAALNLTDTGGDLGKSIMLIGDYKAPDSEDWIPFTATSEEGFGTFLLAPTDPGIRLGDGVVSIVVTRTASTLFDNIDFGTSSPDTIGFSVLRQLSKSAAITVNQ